MTTTTVATPPPLSRQRDATPENNNHLKKHTGCLSGILRLFSRHHHSHSRKRLSTGEKKDRRSASPEKSLLTAPGTVKKIESEMDVTRTSLIQEKSAQISDSWLRSSDSARSPTIKPEIRRWRPTAAESPRRLSPSVVERLMGLEKAAAPQIDENRSSSPESAAEKRRKLLGALEKCDEDLKVLKQIIEVVQAEEEMRRASPEARSGVRRREIKDSGEVDSSAEEEKQQQLPSPVSVLDAVASSPRCRAKRSVRGGPRGSRHQRANAVDILPRAVRRELRYVHTARTNGGDRRRTTTTNAECVTDILESPREIFGIGIRVVNGIFLELVGEVVAELEAKSSHYPQSGTCKKMLCL